MQATQLHSWHPRAATLRQRPAVTLHCRPAAMAQLAAGRLLLAFDFDHTVVDGNTDTWITRVLPDGLPQHLKDSYISGGWTEYMQRVLQHLHSAGATPEDLQQVLQRLPYTAGMEDLWKQLQSRQQAGQAIEAIILSDSNSHFINWILSSRGHAGLFLDVYTNPASITQTGMLQLAPHHSHSCPVCPVNMCKRAILQQHLQREQAGSGSGFDMVAYVGDGNNDLCAAQALRKQDVLFVRSGFALDYKLTSDAAVAASIAAEVVRWSSAEDIMRRLAWTNAV